MIPLLTGSEPLFETIEPSPAENMIMVIQHVRAFDETQFHGACANSLAIPCCIRIEMSRCLYFSKPDAFSCHRPKGKSTIGSLLSSIFPSKTCHWIDKKPEWIWRMVFYVRREEESEKSCRDKWKFGAWAKRKASYIQNSLLQVRPEVGSRNHNPSTEQQQLQNSLLWEII